MHVWALGLSCEIPAAQGEGEGGSWERAVGRLGGAVLGSGGPGEGGLGEGGVLRRAVS